MSIPRKSLLAGFAGAALAIVGLLAVLIWIARRDQLPLIDRSIHDTSIELWKSAGPASYDIRVEVKGRQPATYEAHVRDAVTIRAARNGYPLQQARTLGTWSVPGMFNTIGYDVEAIDKSTAASPSHLTIRGEFDAEYGYPAQYRRIEWGANTEVHWQVTRFEVVSPETPVPRESNPDVPRPDE